MPPFYALYGYDYLSFVDLILLHRNVPTTNDFIKQNQDIINSLKDNLHHSPNKQKLYADRKGTKKHR